jgi:hypothetical protein
MKGIVALGLAAAGLASAGYYAIAVDHDGPAPIQTTEVSPVDRFVLRSSATNRSCELAVEQDGASGTAQVKVEPDCAGLVPGIENVRYWQDKGNGSVSLAADGLDPVITFAIADGVAYESLEPAFPVISLDAVEAPAAP